MSGHCRSFQYHPGSKVSESLRMRNAAATLVSLKKWQRLDLGQYSTTPKSTAFDPRYASQPNFLERLEDPTSLSCQISSCTDRAFPFCNKSISSQFLSIARPRSWWCSPGELPPPPWQTLGSWLLLLNRICELCVPCFTCCLFVKCLFFWMLGIFFGLIFFPNSVS